ncbi:MAG: hypothetical protein H7A51_12335 [Akkermansiaceae bacterium]|nr:hypothetical protein [Akkermansiaceae bacterium]
MQNHPSNKNAKTTPSGAYDPDILSAIEAAAAAADEEEESASASSVNTTQQTRRANLTKKIRHDHRDEICEKEYDAMLNEAFEAREARDARNKKRFRIATAACFLITVGSAGAWYAASEDNRTAVHNLWGSAVAITADVKEGTDVVAIMDKYDEALDKIEERQGQVTDAAIELGADPSNGTAESRKQLDKSMQNVTGDARTVQQRDEEIRKRFGKMAEQARSDIEAKRAEQKAEQKAEQE